VVLQGAGKVGGAVLRELAEYGVNVVAVADAGGAVTGNALDVAELLEAVRSSDSNSVIGAVTNVENRIEGAAEGARVLELDCDLLVLAALENAVTAANASLIKAAIVACGSNGPNTAKAERILSEAGGRTTVLYDFLANGGGVIASYFEWLRNLAERFRYEAEIVRGEGFDIDVMQPYIMPEFSDRIKAILMQPESEGVTGEWNALMRDILVAAVNEDYAMAARNGLSMKTAGYVDAILRTLTALLLELPPERREACWARFPARTRELFGPYFSHPEARLHSDRAEEIAAALYAAGD
jgi:glutamate dehydrogenase (NAD(P)+)